MFLWCVCLLICLSGNGAPAQQSSIHTNKFTLNHFQSRNLAKLVLFALDQADGRSEEQQLLCLTELVALVDSRFTGTAPLRVRTALLSESEGLSLQEIQQLTSSLKRQLETYFQANTEVVVNCRHFELGYKLEAANRIATAFGRACALKNSAHFSGLAVFSFSGMFTQSWTGSPALRTFLSMLFGLGGAWLVLYRLATHFYVFKKRSRVACGCRMCRSIVLLEHEIGSGGFGKVYMCKVVGSKTPCVIKIIQVDGDNNVNDMQDAIDEATNLVKLAHPTIVSYKDVFIHRNEGSQTDFVCIVMEYCDKGSLLDIVSAGKLTFTGLVNALRQISLALEYTHSQGVLHCDIKLDNIFVLSGSDGSSDKLKVGDFGLATKLKLQHSTHLDTPKFSQDSNFMRTRSENTATAPVTTANAIISSDIAATKNTSTRATKSLKHRTPHHKFSTTANLFASSVGGTPCYQAPEIFDDQGIGPASDVWGVGCLLYEAATGEDVPEVQPVLGQRALASESWTLELNYRVRKVRKGLTAMLLAERSAKLEVSASNPQSPTQNLRAQSVDSVPELALSAKSLPPLTGSLNSTNGHTSARMTSEELEAYMETSPYFVGVADSQMQGCGNVPGQSHSVGDGEQEGDDEGEDYEEFEEAESEFDEGDNSDQSEDEATFAARFASLSDLQRRDVDRVCSLFEEMLISNPLFRPSFRQLLTRPVLRERNENIIYNTNAKPATFQAGDEDVSFPKKFVMSPSNISPKNSFKGWDNFFHQPGTTVMDYLHSLLFRQDTEESQETSTTDYDSARPKSLPLPQVIRNRNRGF